MNTDFRLSIGLTSNPKTIKLMRRCGDRAFFCLIQLWGWVAQYRPEGDLVGMDTEAIEIAAGWAGVEGQLVEQLSAIGFLDGEDGAYSLHDWEEIQDVQSLINISKGIVPGCQKKDVTQAEWKMLRQSVFERDNFTCQYCGKIPPSLDCDHVIPLSRGGESKMENLVAACPSCNRSKNARTPEEWLQ